jgi:AraC-like DNA-binding protein
MSANMNSSLHHRKDWAALAKKNRYRATDLAQQCGVSLRQLERHSKAVFGASPHQWMRALRLQQAITLIRRRLPLQDVSRKTGYKDAAHFTHDFKNYFGFCPSDLQKNPSLLRRELKTSRFSNSFFLPKGRRGGTSPALTS